MFSMNVVVYVNPTDDSTKKFISVIPTLSVKENVIICSTLDSLTTRLRQPKDDQTVIVLFAASREELAGILSIRDFLLNRKLIIILPDREYDTIAKGYSLHPRFLTFADNDFGDTVAVINKMTKNTFIKS
jgi:hypothetical protein